MNKSLPYTKLTIISNGPFGFDGSKYRGLKVFVNYIEKLIPIFSEIRICTPILRKGEEGYDSVSGFEVPGDIKFIELPSKVGKDRGFIQKIIRQFKITQVICKRLREWDLIYIFIPSSAGAITFYINKFFRKPFFVYLASDWQDILPYTFEWVGIRKYILYPIYKVLYGIWEAHIVRNSPLTLVVGSALYDKYNGNEHPIYQTVPLIDLPSTYLFNREDTCISEPIKCLFVGSLTSRKGVKYLIEGVHQLIRESYRIKLNIVGSGGLENKLKVLTKELGIEDHVKYYGYVKHGSDLFQIYRDSDIFILPTFSEGFPRVLYEAMSQSLPIVTTAVSGIPGLVKNEENALLLPPGDSYKVAESIKRIIEDKELRKRLIRNGRKTVEPILLQDAAEQISTLLNKHLSQSL